MSELREAVEKAQDRQYSEVEKQAMDKGWNPDPSQLPEGKRFVSAEEFIERGSFFEKIESLNKEIEGYRNSVDEMKSHYEKVAKRDAQKAREEYENKLASLKAEKKEALDQGDSQRVVDIDDEISRVRPPENPNINEANKLIAKWKSENKWYDEDAFLGDEADILFSEYARRGIPLETALSRATNHLSTKYPDKFSNKKREEPPAVEGATPPKPASKSASEKDLTAEEREVYRNMERLGLFKDDKDGSKRKQYLRDVIELRD